MLAELETESTEKQAAARKSTLASVVVNVVLMSLQIVVGVIAHSQALVADGVHSLADLISDLIVLVANRASAEKPDAKHNYGHARYETVASLFLGGLLVAVGVGMLWRAGVRLTNLNDIPAVHASALAVAALVLVSKEALFRYMLREAQRVRSAMLIANAWHARSDAASSLVVGLGIIGSLAGVRLLDPIAAAIVGFLVGRMGCEFAWNALQDLSDRALDEAATAGIRGLLATTPGVLDVHELRTRKMGDFALVDAHILVDPLISVSEGHYIAESARARLLTDKHVIDALIHVDPENDAIGHPPASMPTRAALAELVEAELGRQGVRAVGLNVHYLSTGLDVDITLAPDTLAERAQRIDPAQLKARLGARNLTLQRRIEPSPAQAPSAGGANSLSAWADSGAASHQAAAAASRRAESERQLGIELDLAQNHTRAHLRDGRNFEDALVQE